MSEQTPPCPVFRGFAFSVQSHVAQVECINLLAQAMECFVDLPERERLAVAAWFGKAYGPQKDPGNA